MISLKKSIVNILYYIGKLDKNAKDLTYLDILSPETKIEILENAGIDEIDKICNLSSDFNDVCETKALRSLLISIFSGNDNLDVSDYTTEEFIRKYYIHNPNFDYDNENDKMKIEIGTVNQLISSTYDSYDFVLFPNGNVSIFYNDVEQIINISRVCDIFKSIMKMSNGADDTTVVYLTAEEDYYAIKDPKNRGISILLTLTNDEIKKGLNSRHSFL